MNNTADQQEEVVTTAALGNIWRRVEISPGIELHVHAAALSDEATEQLRGRLLRELGVLRGWFRAEKQ